MSAVTTPRLAGSDASAASDADLFQKPPKYPHGSTEDEIHEMLKIISERLLTKHEMLVQSGRIHMAVALYNVGSSELQRRQLRRSEKNTFWMAMVALGISVASFGIAIASYFAQVG